MVAGGARASEEDSHRTVPLLNGTSLLPLPSSSFLSPGETFQMTSSPPPTIDIFEVFKIGSSSREALKASPLDAGPLFLLLRLALGPCFVKNLPNSKK